jgi:hypothetical protein
MTLEAKNLKDIKTASALHVGKDGVEPSSTQKDQLRDNGDSKAAEKERPIDGTQTAEEEETIASGKRKYAIGTQVLKVKKCRYDLLTAILPNLLFRALIVHCSLSTILSAQTAL